MGHKKPCREPQKGKASEQATTHHKPRIYRKGDQIRTLSGNRWDVTSQSMNGEWYRVSFALVSHMYVPYHRKGVYVLTHSGCRTYATLIV